MQYRNHLTRIAPAQLGLRRALDFHLSNSKEASLICPLLVLKAVGFEMLQWFQVDGDDVTKDQISKVSRWLAIKLNIFIQEKSTYAKITQSHRMFILIFLTKIFYLGGKH